MQLRDQHVLGAVGVISALAVANALVSQHLYEMLPCAWCVFQRLIYVAIAVVSALGSIGHPGKLRVRAGLLLVLALCIGGIVSARYQINVASNMFSCAQTFADQFMTQSGLDSGVPWLFGIMASCMDAKVNVLGVEYAVWSLTLFWILLAVTVFGLWKSFRGN